MLRICELTLAGFGIYEKPTRFLLPAEGSAIFWGSNETGKSTFLWGVAAVWFGLPKSSDPSKIGTRRFGSYSRPGEFWGEIVWTQNGERFRLRRDFEAQTVRLSEETLNGERILFEGEHNPQGRSSAGSAFGKHLRERLGLSQLELYLETFCLSQPMAGTDSLGHELQHLISGSRAANIDDVLTNVWNQVRHLTRSTGDLGLARPGTTRPTNQREAGKIERIETAMAQGRLDEKLARNQLEKLNDGNQALDAANQAVDEIKLRQEARSSRLEALGRWVKANKERVRRTERLRQLENTLEEYDRVVLQKIEVEKDLAGKHIRYQDAPKDLLQQLEDVENAARAYDRVIATQEESEEKKTERTTELAKLEEELSTRFAKVRGRSDWVDTRRKLLDAVARYKAESQEIEDLRKDMSKREAELEATESLDKFAAEACQAHAGLLTESYHRLQRVESRLSDLAGQLEDRDFLQEDDRLAQLREKLELEAELRDTSIRIREKKATLAASPVPDPSPEEQDGESTENGPSTEPFTGSLDTRLPSVPRATWPAGLLVAIASMAALQFGLLWNGAASVAFGAAVFFLWFVVDRKRIARLVRERAESGPGQRLRLRLQETQPEARPATEAEPAVLTAAAELETLLEKHHELEYQRQDLTELLGPYGQSSTAQLAAMEERWRMLDEQKAELWTERAEVLESRFGAADADDWKTLPVSEADKYAERLLQLPGSPNPDDHPTMLDLLTWLCSLEDRDWNLFKRAEEAREEAFAKIESTRQRIGLLEEKANDESEMGALRDQLAPFTLETDPKELLRLTEDCEDTERRVQSLKERLAEGPDKMFGHRLEQCRERIDATWTRLAAAWTCERPENSDMAAWAKTARDGAIPARDAEKEIAQLKESALSILRGSLFQNREQISEDRTAESAALGQTVRDLTHLEESELSLATEDADPNEDRATRLGKLENQEQRAEQTDKTRLETAEENVRRLLRGMASLEGREIPNLASLEIRMNQREEELADCTRERDALAMAFQWMEEAAETYKGTYRETLEHRITQHFRGLTAGDRTVAVNDKFEIGVRDSAGRELCLDQLSQGTRDQLLLAVRLGVADLLSSSVPLPFFFDDAFVHFDDARLSLTQKTLNSLGRQWILLTHRKDLSGWADPIFTSDPVANNGTDARKSGTNEALVGDVPPDQALVPAAEKPPTGPRRRATDTDRRKRKSSRRKPKPSAPAKPGRAQGSLFPSSKGTEIPPAGPEALPRTTGR